MNKLFKILSTTVLGVALAVGVGVGVAQSGKANEVGASTTASVTLSSGSYSSTNKDITWSLPGITIKQIKGTSTTDVNSGYISAPRVYKGHILSFTCASGYKINSMSITYTGKYKGNSMTAGTTVSENIVTDNTTDVSRTWATSTGGGTHTVGAVADAGLSTIYIQNVASADNVQLRFTALSITYTSSTTEYTVSFNANGGTGDMLPTKTTGEYTAPACGFTAPEGQFFTGWKIENTGTLYSEGSDITISADSTLYAQWVNQYTVSFNANGGTGEMEPVKTNPSYTIPVSTFTAPSGKVFDAWNTESGGSGTRYEVDEEVTLSGDTTLYAQWIDKTLNTTYYFNGSYFSSFASSWTTTYGTHTGLNGKSDLGGNYDATVDLYYASKQTGSASITTMPAFRPKAATGTWKKVVSFKLNESDIAISSVSATFKQWGSKTPDVALFAGSEVTGTPISTLTIGSSSLVLSGNMNALEFSIGYCDKNSTNGAQSGLESISVSFRQSSAVAYATSFNNAGLCDGGVTAPSTSTWSSLSTSYSSLDALDKELFVNGDADESGSAFGQCLARYDYILGKYGTTSYSNFMGRTVTPVGSASVLSTMNADNNIIIIVVISVVSLTALGGYFFIRRRKETH